MPRKLRLEFPGACYHVINRGNYRAPIFKTPGAKLAFEKCLFECCAKSGWVLHAFVIMRNHYHLALETPEGNLVAGMQWLQATFACRFNRYRDERGHLFQGRYKALLVEAGEPLALVGDYLHLNPVRAGIVEVAGLRGFRESSYWYLWRPKERPAFMNMATVLRGAGSLPDNPEGWRAYQEHLEWQVAAGPAGRSRAYVKMSRGWLLGSADFKQMLLREHSLTASSRAWETQGAREIREQQWAAALARCLAHLRRKPAGLKSAPKSAEWKIATAAALKTCTLASNRWLAQHLWMGTPVAVSHWVGHLRRTGGAGAALREELILKLKT